jgi:hypothetical protein
MVQVDVDFAYNELLQEVLKTIRANKGRIIDFDPTGPGGGNPNILLSFPSEKEAMAFLITRYPDDEESFHRSRVRETA